MEDYKKRSESNFADLNERAIWLFLATVSCYSLPSRVIKSIGVAIVLAFFVYQLLASISAEDIAAAKQRKLLRDSLSTDDPIFKECMELLDFKYSGWRYKLRHGWPYIIAITFWVFSFYYNVLSK